MRISSKPVDRGVGRNLFPSDRHPIDGDEEESRVEDRYHSLYEDKMNPFMEFSHVLEKNRKLNELSVADRIVYNTTMAVVSSNSGRTFLLLYLLSMHLLVFITIYYSIHRVHYGCDPNLDTHHS